MGAATAPLRAASSLACFLLGRLRPITVSVTSGSTLISGAVLGSMWAEAMSETREARDMAVSFAWGWTVGTLLAEAGIEWERRLCLPGTHLPRGMAFALFTYRAAPDPDKKK